MSNIIKNAFIDAIGTAVYVVLVASFMFLMQESMPREINSAIISIAMLLLFVFSAALTGIMVFGKPIIWYLNGKKKEAISLISWTLLILFIIILIVFLILFCIR